MTRRHLCLALAVALATTWVIYRAQARADALTTDQEDHPSWL